jgi:hypothetical protein
VIAIRVRYTHEERRSMFSSGDSRWNRTWDPINNYTTQALRVWRRPHTIHSIQCQSTNIAVATLYRCLHSHLVSLPRRSLNIYITKRRPFAVKYLLLSYFSHWWQSFLFHAECRGEGGGGGGDCNLFLHAALCLMLDISHQKHSVEWLERWQLFCTIQKVRLLYDSVKCMCR